MNLHDSGGSLGDHTSDPHKAASVQVKGQYTMKSRVHAGTLAAQAPMPCFDQSRVVGSWVTCTSSQSVPAAQGVISLLGRCMRQNPEIR